MNSSLIPKTFFIFATSGNNGESGFLRQKSYQSKEGNISYEMILVKGKSEASKFLNFDNVKKLSLEYMTKYNLENIKIIDSSSGKVTNVKESKTKEK